jgi:hypothetical protein
MEGGGHGQLDLEEAVEFLPERTGEPDVAVGDKLAGKAMAAIDMVEVELCGILGSDWGVGGDEDDGLRHIVDDHEDGVEAAAWR